VFGNCGWGGEVGEAKLRELHEATGASEFNRDGNANFIVILSSAAHLQLWLVI